MHFASATPHAKCSSGLTDTLVWVVGGRSRPRSVVVERLASLTVDSGRVVSTVARLAGRTRHAAGHRRRRPDGIVPVDEAPRRVPVALAAAADRHVGDGVVDGRSRGSASPASSPASPRQLVRRPVDPGRSQDDANVGRRDPVLQHGARVELQRRRSSLERAESHAIRV